MAIPVCWKSLDQLPYSFHQWFCMILQRGKSLGRRGPKEWGWSGLFQEAGWRGYTWSRGSRINTTLAQPMNHQNWVSLEDSISICSQNGFGDHDQSYRSQAHLVLSHGFLLLMTSPDADDEEHGMHHTHGCQEVPCWTVSGKENMEGIGGWNRRDRGVRMVVAVLAMVAELNYWFKKTSLLRCGCWCTHGHCHVHQVRMAVIVVVMLKFLLRPNDKL